MKRSLFWNLFIPVVIVFALGLGAIALYMPTLMERNATNDAVASAEDIAKRLKIIRGYYTDNVIKKVVGKGDFKGSFEHKTDPNAIPLPATMIHDLSELFSEQGAKIKLYSAFPFPNRKERQLDAFGKRAWDALSSNPDQVLSQTEQLDGKTTVRVAIADKMISEACVSCHNARPDTPKNTWKLGDVRGVLEINLSIEETLASSLALGNTILGIIVALLIIACFALYFVYHRTIGLQLKRVRDALWDIAQGEGDLTLRLPSEGENETAQIGQAFNAFVGKIQKTVAEIGDSSNQVATASTELSAITAQTSETIRQQDEETEQVATAINEMGATAQDMARHASNAAQAAKDTDQAADEGREVVVRTVNSIAQLSQEMESAAGVLAELQKGAQNVGGVLEVIRGIAEQTNLLALNAAIEAARAGEQGRGFAVVADEVRTLAGRTQESTREIEQMIDQLQSAAKQAVSAMEQSRTRTQHSVNEAGKAGTALEHIVAAVNAIKDMNDQIACAAEEQAQLVEAINQNVSSITQLSQQTAEGGRQTAISSESLASLAVSLQHATSQFKT